MVRKVRVSNFQTGSNRMFLQTGGKRKICETFRGVCAHLKCLSITSSTFHLQELVVVGGARGEAVSCRRLRVFKSFLIKNAPNAGRPVSITLEEGESGEANTGSAHVPLIIHSLSSGHFFFFFLFYPSSLFSVLLPVPVSPLLTKRALAPPKKNKIKRAERASWRYFTGSI